MPPDNDDASDSEQTTETSVEAGSDDGVLDSQTRDTGNGGHVTGNNHSGDGNVPQSNRIPGTDTVCTEPENSLASCTGNPSEGGGVMEASVLRVMREGRTRRSSLQPRSLADLVRPRSRADLVPPMSRADLVPPMSRADLVPPMSRADRRSSLQPRSRADLVQPRSRADLVPPMSRADRRSSLQPRSLADLVPPRSRADPRDYSRRVSLPPQGSRWGTVMGQLGSQGYGRDVSNHI
jgi:hypothetical protein